MSYVQQFIGMVVAALLAGVATYAFTKQLNYEASLQQNYLSSVQEFSATGAKVDAAITDLADAAVDGEGLDEAKKNARQAIAAHAAATLTIRPVIGQGNMEEYMKGVADMRVLVDQTGDVPAAIRASKGRFALIENRMVIVEEARKRIYG